MKIVNIIGGLGNQMFQYAFATVLKEKLPNEEVLVDTQLFKYPFIKKLNNNNFYHNGYEINKVFPNATLPIASVHKLAKVTYYIPNYVLNRLARKILPRRKSEYRQSNDYSFDPVVFSMEKDCFLEGCWQHFQYFEDMRDVLLRTFQFMNPNEKNKKTAEIMKEHPSIGIHVRRGDYVGKYGFGDVCNLDYYKNAIGQLDVTEDTMFYVFSNEIEWCEDNLRPIMKNVTYVDWNKGNDSAWDMFLMSQCEQLIIANSSFSWWGAYLNRQVKKVVAPKLWNRYFEDMHIQMPEWQLI